MRLTAFTDYALRVLIYLAAQPGQRATIAQVAAAFAVSENHLTKVVHCLGKAGWLANARGKGGGLELAMAPARIRVGTVVHQTEGRSLPAECFRQEAPDCSIVKVCRLRGVLAQADEAFYAALDRYTLADLVCNAPRLARVLFRRLPARRAAARSTA